MDELTLMKTKQSITRARLTKLSLPYKLPTLLILPAKPTSVAAGKLACGFRKRGYSVKYSEA